MTILDDMFTGLQAERRAALVGYLPAGFPDLTTSKELFGALIDGGCDLVEVGLPFSDPVLDGPVIQNAAQQALAGGFRVRDTFDIVESVTARGGRAVVDVHDSVELFRFAVGRAPQALAVSANGDRLYVNNFMDRSIGVFDLSALENTGQWNVPLVGTLASVGTERLSAAVLVGKQLFYDAKDQRLARDAYLSCASCHNDGGQDGRVWDLTGMGEGLRNTINLRGTAAKLGRLHWTGNFDEVQDFEGQIRGLAGGTGLMTNAQFNAGTRSQPLGDKKAGVNSDLDALAAYVASLNTFAPSPFRNADGSLTPSAQAGRALFESKNCGSCHGGSAFTNSGSNTCRHQ